MIKIWTILILVFTLTYGFSQSEVTQFKWYKKHTYKIGKKEVWNVDALQNFYVSDAGIMNKYDSVGVLKFSQSIKSLGNMSQLVPVNTMKLIHFSEEQQTLCYFDNTLSSMDDCIELSEEGFVNASMISSSNQPDKVWILDNLNSTLVLLSMKDLSQRQEVKNLKGILDLNQIDELIERNNNLYLLDRGKGVYIFDMYGSLIDYYEDKLAISIDAYENNLFALNETSVSIRSKQTDEKIDIPLPIADATEMIYSNKFFYFRVGNSVHKFELQFFE